MPTEDNNTNHDASSAYTIEKEDVLTELDPQLQSIILARRQGQELPRHLVETVTEDGQDYVAVDVIARLKTPGQSVAGLWIAQKTGPFVTGLVDVDRITEVRKEVKSLKAARRLTKTLSNSVPEISGTPAQIRAETGRAPVDGSNVIVGIIDYGCDFAHPHFRTLDDQKKTRILFLWDQRGGTTSDSPVDFDYGREFNADAINYALENPDPGPAGPHHKLGYVLDDDHGTQVMDMAAGNGGGINPPGVAPGADIIFVEASLDDPEPGQSFGNSAHLIDAVKYIFNRAQELNRPAVVNISSTLNAGPHDGSTPVEQTLDWMLQTPGRAIVMAAGNSNNAHKHLRRRVYPGKTTILRWNIPPNDNTTNKVEMWYDGRHAAELTLSFTPAVPTDPYVRIGPFPLDTTYTIHKTIGNESKVAGRVFHRAYDSGNGDNNIVIEFEPLMEPGDWKLELKSADPLEATPFDVDAWIERDNGQGATFPDQQSSDSLCTLGTLGCGYSTIVVSAYNSLEPHGIMNGSGAGPTRDGKLKPEVSAPGVNVKAAAILTNTVQSNNGGTSFSAPHVTGLIALLMQRAGTFLTIEQTRDLLMNYIRKSPPSTSNAWDPRFGMGRINAAASIKATPLPPPPSPPQPAIVVLEHSSLVATGTTELATVGVSVETVSAVIAPVLYGSNGTAPVDPPESGGGGEAEPPVTPRPFRTGH